MDDGGGEADLAALADLVTPMALRVVATLRLADHLADASATAEELAVACGAEPDALDRVLRHLAAIGVLSRDSSGRYSLTPRGEELRGDHPAGLRGRLDIAGALGRAELSFVDLLDSVRSGSPAFDRRYGRSFWEDLTSDPPRADSYDEQMGQDVEDWAVDILPAYDWGSLGHVVDIGGGNGTLLIALLDTHQDLRGTVVDQPRTVAAARSALEAAGMAARADAVAGSFFDPLPGGAGGYILCAILHDWDDEAAGAILKRCAEAAGAEGRVFVIEKTGAGGEAPSTSMDLRMLLYFGARERGVAAISTLAAEAGLRTVAVHPAGDLSVIELVAR